jgi:hypothetical protein
VLVIDRCPSHPWIECADNIRDGFAGALDRLAADEWVAQQDDSPTRPEAVRRMIQQVLSASRRRAVEKDDESG